MVASFASHGVIFTLPPGPVIQLHMVNLPIHSWIGAENEPSLSPLSLLCCTVSEISRLTKKWQRRLDKMQHASLDQFQGVCASDWLVEQSEPPSHSHGSIDVFFFF